jgi:hypothetical protein
MNCQEFWKNPPGAQPGERQRHLAACTACAAQMQQRSSLAGALLALAAESRGAEAPARLEARLVAAFRAHHGRPALPKQPLWSQAALWASAAATVVLALFLVNGHQPQAPRPHLQNTMELAALQDAAVIDENTLDDRTAGFIPLPNAASLAPNEEVNLVRVDVPRSAMMAVGLVVSEERALERVQADVMLGADGLPRAVRFLDE